jgi:LacI family transcriptional regulator
MLEQRGVVVREASRGVFVLPKAVRTSGQRLRRMAVGLSSIADGGLIAGLSSQATALEWQTVCIDLTTPDSRRRLFDELSRGGIDGVLLVACLDRELVAELTRNWGGPVVLADHWFEDLRVTGVTDDAEGGARQAVNHLLALGHRRIGYVEISRREYNPWRYRGYRLALEEAGIPLDEKLVVPSAYSLQSSRLAAEQLLGLNEPPTAILAFDRLRAWGVWRAVELRGLTIGKDLSLVAFDRGDVPPELTAVRADGARLGQAAVERLTGIADGKAEPGGLVTIPTELVVGQSSGPAVSSASGAPAGNQGS